MSDQGQVGGGQSRAERDAGSIAASSESDRSWEHGGEGEKQETPALEWVVAIIGVLLVAGALGFLLYQAVKGDSSPPSVSVEVLSVTKIQSGYLVKIRATNQGGSTAAGLKVKGALRQGGRDVETSHITLDYLPAHSTGEGGLFFTQDPQRFELLLRAEGYQQP